MNFEYSVIYSRRRSISVTISSDNTVTVRCPKHTDVQRIEKFLSEKSDWINKHLQNNAAKLEENSDIINGKAVLVGGERRTLVIGERSEITAEAVQIKSVKHLKNLLVGTFGGQFFAKVKEISDAIGLTPNGVSFRDYKSRWGCCNAKNQIVFNYKMLMLPEKVQIYVIIHELCHIKQHNHSAAFYALVRRFMPDYKEAERELKNYDFITRLY